MTFFTILFPYSSVLATIILDFFWTLFKPINRLSGLITKRFNPALINASTKLHRATNIFVQQQIQFYTKTTETRVSSHVLWLEIKCQVNRFAVGTTTHFNCFPYFPEPAISENATFSQCLLQTRKYIKKFVFNGSIYNVFHNSNFFRLQLFFPRQIRMLLHNPCLDSKNFLLVWFLHKLFSFSPNIDKAAWIQSGRSDFSVMDKVSSYVFIRRVCEMFQ